MKTPLLESPRLNDRLGGRLLIKPECLQRTGSFKFRGAFNKIVQIPDDDKSRGVVAFSSGNHAQGVAAAAQILGLPATIVMPSDAPAIKITSTKSYGATVVPYERKDGNRVQVAERILGETGGSMVPPYNDFDVIAGQGTIGLEMAEQASTLGTPLDVVLGPSSGGGMLSGVATALGVVSSDTIVYSVEPAFYDDIAQSLEAGRRIEIETGRPSVCDALLVEMPGDLTFEIMKARVTSGFSVSDDDALAAVKLAFEEFKIVLEPSGAIALAAVLTGKVDIQNKTVGVVCTGGNVDPDLFTRALNS